MGVTLTEAIHHWRWMNQVADVFAPLKRFLCIHAGPTWMFRIFLVLRAGVAGLAKQVWVGRATGVGRLRTES